MLDGGYIIAMLCASHISWCQTDFNRFCRRVLLQKKKLTYLTWHRHLLRLRMSDLVNKQVG
jgi:hypothetical protein